MAIDARCVWFLSVACTSETTVMTSAALSVALVRVPEIDEIAAIAAAAWSEARDSRLNAGDDAPGTTAWARWLEV